MKIPFPDFFVVGAPRCGTTSLCRYLAQHPQICFSYPKEPHYFSRLEGPVDPERIRHEYLERCFAHRGPQHRLMGEGSVSYLYSAEAIEHILALGPESRFIVQVRNPFDMLRSYHLRLLFVLEEDERDFAVAWSLQAARLRGERIPRHCWDRRLLQYAEIGSLGTALERMLKRVGPERCLPIVFDDLVAGPREVYERVLRFLGIESDGRTRFPRKRGSHAWRHRWLQVLLYRPPSFVARAVNVRVPSSEEQSSERARGGGGPGTARRLIRSAGRAIRRGRLHLLRWNRIDASPEPLPVELRAEMQAVLIPEIHKLAEILGRDLSHWT